MIRAARRRLAFAGVGLALMAVWVGSRYWPDEPSPASPEQVELMRERARVEAIVARRRRARRVALVAEVKRRLDTGEDPAAVRAWAEQRSDELSAAAAERETRGE